jgi:hypothetical protein
MLSSEPQIDSDSKYISMYSMAMIAEVNGNRSEFNRISEIACRIPAKHVIRRNLPLRPAP